MVTGFYMIYVEGEHSPTYKHQTIQSAESEAKRLAKLTGKKVYVLNSYKDFSVNEFTTNIHRMPDEIPF